MTAARAAAPLPPARRRALAELRLIAQGIVDQSDGAAPFASPAAVAAHLVCAQGQHLGAVRAALALRLPAAQQQRADAPEPVGLADPRAAAVTTALERGEIVRGYPMRGTLFAAAADDLAWMSELTRDRQLAGADRRRAEQGFTDASIERLAEEAREAIRAGGGAITRDELGDALAAGGTALDGGQRYHLIYTLMVRGELAYGGLRGDEPLLVDAGERLPPGSSLAARFDGDEEAAIAEWLGRYLAGHGPATLRDFQWWTKLPLGALRRVESLATAGLEQYGEDALGEALWGPPGLRDRREALGGGVARGRLLPPFDEVVLGYPDRELIIAPAHHARIVPGRNGVFQPTAHRRGSVVAVWRTAGSGARRRLELDAFEPLPAVAEREFRAAFAAYPR